MFKYDKHNKYHRLLRQILIIAVSLVIFVEAWWVVSIIADVSTVPTPAQTWNALVDLIQNRDGGQLYQDIRGHNLNDEVDRKTEFAEALEDSGVEDKEIQYIMEVVGPILDGLEIKKSFRDIMRERNPDWE